MTGPRFPARLVWTAAALWAGPVLLFHYFHFFQDAAGLLREFPLPDFPPVSVKALLLSAGRALWGALFLGLAGLAGGLAGGLFYRGSTGLERFIFSTGAGLALFSLAQTALGFAGFLRKWPSLACCAVLAGAGLFSHAGLRRREPAAVLPPSAPLDLLDRLLVLLLAALAAVNLLGALGPEVFYDSLVYHLAVPSAYNAAGGIIHIPFNLYSDLPLAHGMLYSAALFFGGEVCAKFLNFSAGLLTVLAVLALGSRLAGRREGLWGAAVFYAVTHTMRASWPAGSDLPLALFSFLALFAALGAEGKQRYGRLVLAGLMGGMAMAAKYTGLFPVLGAAAAYLVKERRFDRAVLKELALAGAVAGVVLSPWLVKNLVYKGNPVYPFLSSVFGTGALSDPEKIEGFLRETSQLDRLTPAGWFSHPWKATMGEFANSSFFSPLFLAFLPLCLLFRSPPRVSPLWAYFLVVWTCWSLSSTMVRFSLPAWPAAGLLIAAAFLAGREPSRPRTVFRGGMFASFALSGLCGTVILLLQGGHLVPLGAEGREEFLVRTRPGHAYSSRPAYDFINSELPRGARVLVLGDARIFGLERPYLASSVFDLNPVVELSAASRSGGELYSRLRAAGVTHIVLNVSEAIRLGRGYRTFYWDAAARRVFYEFWDRHLVELRGWNETADGRFLNRVVLYELAGADPARRPPANLVRDAVMRGIERSG